MKYLPPCSVVRPTMAVLVVVVLSMLGGADAHDDDPSYAPTVRSSTVPSTVASAVPSASSLPSHVPTTTPSSSPTVSSRPSWTPTVRPSLSPSSSLRPSDVPTASLDVMLQLYREDNGDDPLCMACEERNCAQGLVVLRRCDRTDPSQQWYLAFRGDHKLRPSLLSEDVCLSYKQAPKVRLRDCAPNRDYYQDVRVRTMYMAVGDDKLQIRGRNDNHCLTVLDGDVVAGKRLEMTSCAQAERNNVAYWSSGQFGDGNDDDHHLETDNNDHDHDDHDDNLEMDVNDHDHDDQDDDHEIVNNDDDNHVVSDDFQLRLYGAGRCVQCKESCTNGNMVYLQECDTNDVKQRWVTKNDKFRPFADPTLCVDYTLPRDLRLRPCDRVDEQTQSFDEDAYADGLFSYTAYDRASCLTQHPAANKAHKLILTTCDEAAQANRLYWVRGN